MSGGYLSLLLILLVIAALMRDDFAMTLMYLFIGAFAIGTWWARRSLAQLEHTRRLDERAFLGESVEVKLSFKNRSFLPVVWMKVQDALPVALSTSPAYEYVTNLPPHGTVEMKYNLVARKRGYYPIGPLFVSTGDVLGMNPPLQMEGTADHLTVYPRIIPLSSVEIPSRSPQGTMRHTQPIFADPTRVFGKRDYVAGDSLRNVDWKASASAGRLQVKLFEPSIALETMIVLNLNTEDYEYRTGIDSRELAIVIAASIANWVSSKQQTVGLRVNGRDPLAADGVPQYIPPRKGQAHLIRMLETLARIDSIGGSPLAALIQKLRYHLSWGTTLIVITGRAGDELLDELYQARRSGQNAVLILAGQVSHSRETIVRAEHFGIPVVRIPNEFGLDMWRK
jgi:uncharacterized protein (DUF58 family)